jgi:hypothetical protein
MFLNVDILQFVGDRSAHYILSNLMLASSSLRAAIARSTMESRFSPEDLGGDIELRLFEASGWV